MDLLKYEFNTSPDGSYNGILRNLVIMIRHYHSNTPAEEFKAAIPQMHSLEHRLQAIDAEISLPPRPYIQEILDELTSEGSIEIDFFEEVERACTGIINKSFNTLFDLGNYSYVFEKIESFFVLHFLGYQEGLEQPNGEIIVVKQIFRSIAAKHYIVFVDLSANF